MLSVVDLPGLIHASACEAHGKYKWRVMMIYSRNEEGLRKCVQGLPRAKQLE